MASGIHDAVASHVQALRRYARALTRSVDEADDLVQESLTRVLSARAGLPAIRSLRGYLYRVLYHAHLDRRRAEKTAREAYATLDADAVSLPAQEAALELGELRRALDRLTSEQREVVLLVGVEGLGYAEAAEVIGVPIGTVMSRLFRGREALRMELSGERAPRLRRVK